MNKAFVSLVMSAVIYSYVHANTYENLVPKYNRVTSNCMVRKIAVPTAANLDFAAYDANPVLLDRQKAKPKKPSAQVKISEITFDGALFDVKNTISETPLTDNEKAQPLAWKPLTKKLWEVVKDPGFQNIGSKINSYKWSDPNVFLPYQEVVTAYLHGEGNATEVWVKIEFSPWVVFLNNVSDENKDGVKEIYGRLNLTSIAEDSLSKADTWIRNTYTKKVLTREQMVDWITDLASYWYPTKNTDIIDMTGLESWPNQHTKKVALKTMGKITVKNPLAVVEGKPFSPEKPIYNVYIVDEPVEDAVKEVVVPAAAIVKKTIDTLVSKNFTENNAKINAETKQYGDYTAWAKKNSSFLNSLKAHMDKLPPEQMGFKGKEDWVFFRKSVDFILGGDLANQAKDKNPIPHLVEFQNYLKGHNVNMLFVAIPNKEEVYFENLPADVTKPGVPIVNPYSRKFIKDAQAAGIEVIDLLPHFLKAKELDKTSKEPVYQRQDTHWTNRGLQIASDLIATRVKEFAWYNEIQDKLTCTIFDTTFSRQGDIVDKLPETDRPNYPSVLLEAKQVKMPDGKLYKGNNTAPIMLIGDSFTGVFESVDCKGAGLGSHIAAKTGVPVDIITSWGGGPLVRAKAMRAREKDLPYKRLVIYVMVARDLYNYAQSWEPFPAK